MPKSLVIGIQGGPGSFNEEAIRRYTNEAGITHYTLQYLYTTERVLKALHDKKIDRGMFAIENSIGGTVWETVNALSRYNCTILDSLKIQVDHCLMAVPGTKLRAITRIMSHPQALAQCAKTIARKFPKVLAQPGEGIEVDQATAAKHLSEGTLPATIGVIASRAAAQLYGLAILAEGLQDHKKNLTTFLFVSRFDPKKRLGHTAA